MHIYIFTFINLHSKLLENDIINTTFYIFNAEYVKEILYFHRITVKKKLEQIHPELYVLDVGS